MTAGLGKGKISLLSIWNPKFLNPSAGNYVVFLYSMSVVAKNLSSRSKLNESLS